MTARLLILTTLSFLASFGLIHVVRGQQPRISDEESNARLVVLEAQRNQALNAEVALRAHLLIVEADLKRMTDAAAKCSPQTSSSAQDKDDVVKAREAVIEMRELRKREEK